MITGEAASLAISIAKGVIKLGQRVDIVLAEKEATQAALSLTLPTLNVPPTVKQLRNGLEDLLEEDAASLTASQKRAIRNALEARDKPAMIRLVSRHLPKLATSRLLDLNADFVEALRKVRPEWASSPDMLAVAFYVGPGKALRETSYSWRLALTVADVVAELGAENTNLFVRNENMQGLVQSVLSRFGEADLQDQRDYDGVLRAALTATLNGVLDGHEAVAEGNPWLDGLLDALVSARDSMPVAERDEFVMGLVRGKGYPTLVSSILERGAEELDGAEGFKAVAQGFLKHVSGIVAEQSNFENFFEDHWGDLLSGGLSSLAEHAEGLVGDQKLLGKVLKRVATDLANHDASKLLSSETLVGIVDSSLAVVAANPDLAGELLGTNSEWVDALIFSLIDTVADQGVQATFSKDGVEKLFRDAFTTFAEHPELIVKDSKLAKTLVGGVLSKLAETPSFAAGDLANAAVAGALTAMAENPTLVSSKYPELVGDLAKKISALVTEKKVSGILASDLVSVGVQALADNPKLFLDLEQKFVESVVGAVVNASAGDEAGLLAGVLVAEAAQEVLGALAKKGKAALQDHAGEPDPLAALAGDLEKLLGAGLTRAQSELGHTLGLPSLPAVLGELVDAWSNGGLAAIDPENDNFKKLFADVAKKAA